MPSLLPARFRLRPFVAAWVLLLLVPPRLAAADLSVVTPSKTITFTLAEFHALPHVDVDAYDGHDKKTFHYSGVPVRALLTLAGVPANQAVRGPVLRTVILTHAADGYSITFALAEFEPDFTDRQIIVADRQDGQPLPGGVGPLRIVAPGDKRPARWARMLTSLQVTSVQPSP